VGANAARHLLAQRFFGGGTHTATGEEVAWETIKQKLLEIIATRTRRTRSPIGLVNKLSEAATRRPPHVTKYARCSASIVAAARFGRNEKHATR